MIDVGSHSLVLAAKADEVPVWLRPVIEAGRDAAFVDTSYIRALFDEHDDRHAAVQGFHAGLSASLYTSVLVVAEAARQFAKAKVATETWRWDHVDALARFLADSSDITICAPPREFVAGALTELQPMQRVLWRLDLCDLVSMMVLDRLSHKRVLGFDDHFRSVGASLEP